MKFDMHATKLQQVLKGISSEDEACSHAVQAPTARNRRQLMTAYRPGTDRQFGSILPVLAMNTAQVHTCSATPWIRQHVDNFIMQYHATTELMLSRMSTATVRDQLHINDRVTHAKKQGSCSQAR